VEGVVGDMGQQTPSGVDLFKAGAVELDHAEAAGGSVVVRLYEG
jgi:hypothetical protein